MESIKSSSLKQLTYEILTKSLVYRIIAFFQGLLIPLILTGDISIGFRIGFISESAAFVTYFIYEVVYRKYIKWRNIKKGTPMFLINSDKHGWYNVLKVLEDNKLIIEVI